MIQLIIEIALLGMFVWAITTLIPMPPKFAQVIQVFAAAAAVLWVLSYFGLFHGLPRR